MPLPALDFSPARQRIIGIWVLNKSAARIVVRASSFEGRDPLQGLCPMKLVMVNSCRGRVKGKGRIDKNTELFGAQTPASPDTTNPKC